MATWLCTSLQDGGLTRYGLHTGLSNLGLFNGASLDIRFADTKSLVDAVTGQSLVTFTRASSGTSVGSDGLIKTATTNLLLRSEEFDNASWTKANASSIANAAAAPNGFATADKLIEDSSLNIHYAFQLISVTAGNSYTLSVYAKAAERSEIYIALSTFNSAFLSNADCYFNLANGTIRAAGANATARISNAGSGWYRCSITGVAQTTTLAIINAGSLSNGSTFYYTGDGTSGIYLWGAQLEQSSTVGEYIPTTSTINSAPRFDHNPTTGESLGLLVEEQRTNLLLRSEEFGVSPTWAPTDASITSDTQVAPNGLQTADTYTEAATGTPGIFQTATGLTSSAVYTSSIYLKRGSTDWYRLLFVDNTSFSNGARAWVNLGTGAFGTVENIGTGTGVTSTITPLANGWYRVSLSTAMGGSNTTIRFQINSASANSSVSRVLGSAAYLWGAQLEAGAFATSYIPTTTAAATRSADVASITGTNFSSWYRQDEGTVFLDAASYQSVAAANAGAVINDGTLNNRIEIDVRAGSLGGAGRLTVISGGAVSFDTGNSLTLAFAVNTFYRQGASYKLDSFAFSINGGVAQTDTSGGVPTAPDRIELGARLSTALPLNGTIRRLVYWGQRLPNSTLQQITS